MNLRYQTLKAREVELSPTYTGSVVLRTHRALSWLERAEQEDDDEDARFIFLWITFNSLYGREVPDRREKPERRLYKTFLKRLVDADEDNLLGRLVSRRYRQSIVALIENRYVFQPFWEYQAGKLSETTWKRYFSSDRKRALDAIRRGAIVDVLQITLDRLYVLRNQVIHGNATWRGRVNREQIHQGAEIMAFLVPAFLHIVINRPTQDWGEPQFKVVDRPIPAQDEER